MMVWVRQFVSLSLYAAGDLAYRCQLPADDGWLYVRLMQWSAAVQGDGPGPWKKVGK